MDQYIFFYDDYYLQGVDTTPPIKLNARYNLSSSILYDLTFSFTYL